jgi:hypothetical protein
MERTLYTTYLASMFRSVRFGITEAHGRGVAMQFNYLTDEGAIKFNEAKGTFSVDHAKIKDGVTKLTHDSAHARSGRIVRQGESDTG